MSAAEPGFEPPQEESVDASLGTPARGLASTGRRRMLLRGLGRAGAVAAAAVPLRSLAGASKKDLRLPKNGKNYVCTVSAQTSLMHSSSVAGENCRGNPVSYYCQKTSKPYSNWPQSSGNPVCYVGTTAYRSTASFKTVMGVNGSSLDGQAIGTILSSNATSPEAHWITALLNATQCSSNFPYSSADVRELYVNAAKRADALTFFKSYLEGASA